MELHTGIEPVHTALQAVIYTHTVSKWLWMNECLEESIFVCNFFLFINKCFLCGFYGLFGYFMYSLFRNEFEAYFPELYL